MSALAKTLSRHILEEEVKRSEMRGELSILISQMAFASKVLSREMRRAALVGQLGLLGGQNATGDAQKKLDVCANEVVLSAFAPTGLVAGVVSEEMEQLHTVACGDSARYILCTDPLDGSSNTDINGTLGTIFSIYRKQTPGCKDLEGDLLGRNVELVTAGYIMYGPSTVFVYSTGHGVNGFTLDESLGDFLLSHGNIQCPEKGATYSANLGRIREWHPAVRNFVDDLTREDDKTQRPYSLRYSGALVADVHRSLLEGGIYFYPADTKHKNGKLRLMYECIPLAFIAEQAGGAASDGRKRILEMHADSIHARTPFVVGSTADVRLFETIMREDGQHG